MGSIRRYLIRLAGLALNNARLRMFLCGLILSSGWSALGADINNKKVAVFNQAGFPCSADAKSAEWYLAALKVLGCEPGIIDADGLVNEKMISKRNIDTLILPDGVNLPLGADFSILRFMAEGGNVIAGWLPDVPLKKSETNSCWFKAGREYSVLAGRHNEFQLRLLPWKSAAKTLNAQMMVNAAWPDAIKDKLPVHPAPIDKTYQLPDKLNFWNHTSTEKRDCDCGASKNIDTAANIICPVYCLSSGDPADFFAYRYHNRYFNGATLLILGNLGNRLLKGENSTNALSACLQICESKFPEEQPPGYYNHLLEHHRQISSFCREFTETFYPLRDVLYVAYYQNEEERYAKLLKKLTKCEDQLSEVMQEKQALDKLLQANINFSEQDLRRVAQLKRIEQICLEWRNLKKEIKKEAKQIKVPPKVKVRSPLGAMPIEAGITHGGLYMLRKDHFETMRELGVNVWYLYYTATPYRPLFEYFPDIGAQVKKFKLDLTCGDVGAGLLYNLGEIMPDQGKLDIQTGKVTETPFKHYDYEKLEAGIKKYAALWEGFPVYRVFYNTSELALYNTFWGEQARQEYVQHLKTKYHDLTELNKRWKAPCRNFEDITLPVKEPKTETEHAQWEDWIKFREKRYFDTLKTGYDLFKKYAPDIPYSSCVANNCKTIAYAGANYYEHTKCQDISGMDGTAHEPRYEWLYLDLNCGRPVFTMEWGAFYNPPPDILEGRRKLSHQLWQEVSGGHVGINCWFWRVPGFNGNYVDTVGLPTLYGWELKNIASEFREIEHILLDGKRAEPEVRILFSNTSRCHDMGWGKDGDPVFSPHVRAVENWYEYFLGCHVPCRIIDEEAMEEGYDLTNCRLIVVPEAQYLSEGVQKALLKYVQAGGNILIEGPSGRYDNYGDTNQGLLKALDVVPSFLEKANVELHGKLIDLPPQARNYAFTPVLASGREPEVLLRFASGAPALIVLARGSGKMFVNGIPNGISIKGQNVLDRDLFGGVFDPVAKALAMTPKFVCDDRDLLIREWEYNNEPYLICACPKGKNTINRFNLKIRGDWQIYDYLLGMRVPVSFENGYSVFDGIVSSSGGRVYRLVHDGGAKNDKQGAHASQKSDKSKPLMPDKIAGRVMINTFPFEGELPDESTVNIEGYQFQATLIPEGNVAMRGEAYLVISKGNNVQKRKLEPGKSATFVFKDDLLSVECKACRFVMPFAAMVTIKREKAKPLASACSIVRHESDYMLSNGLIKLTVLPGEGGKIIELTSLPEDINHVCSDKKYGGGIKENEGYYPGVLSSQLLNGNIEQDTADQTVLRLAMSKPVDAILESKTLTVKRDEAKANLVINLWNRGAMDTMLALRLHSELRVGGTADAKDRFFVPSKEGVKSVAYAGEGDRGFTPSEGWAACCDQSDKSALVFSFSPEEVETVFLYFADDRYNIELWTPRRKIGPSQSLPLNANIFLLKGLSGIDGFKDGFAVFHALPKESLSQDNDCNYRLEISSVFLKSSRVNALVSIWKDGKKIKSLGEYNLDVSCENPASQNMPLAAKELEDGGYTLQAVVRNDSGKILVKGEKRIVLTGKAQAANMLLYNDLKSGLHRIVEQNTIKQEDMYSAVVLIEEIRAAATANNNEKFQEKVAELKRLLDTLE